MKKSSSKFIWKSPNLPETLSICDNMSQVEEMEEFFETYIENQQLTQEDFDRLTFNKVHFYNCKFENVSFAKCTFEDVIFENSVFLQCNLSRSKNKI